VLIVSKVRVEGTVPEDEEEDDEELEEDEELDELLDELEEDEDAEEEVEDSEDEELLDDVVGTDEDDELDEIVDEEEVVEVADFAPLNARYAAPPAIRMITTTTAIINPTRAIPVFLERFNPSRPAVRSLVKHFRKVHEET
jgi:hypothetical protein